MNIDDCCPEIDPRIKYIEGSPGAQYGKIKVDFAHKGKRIVRTISWGSGVSEMAALNTMMHWLERHTR